MSPAGLIAGIFYDENFYDENFNQMGYVKNGSTFTTIDFPAMDRIMSISACCRSGGAYLKQGSSYYLVSAGLGTYTALRCEQLGSAGGVANGSNTPGTAIHGFIWDAGVATTLNYPGAIRTVLHGINSSGAIVGGAADANGSFWFVATPEGVPVPEPGTTGLTAGALLIAGFRLRPHRRRLS